MFTGIIAYFIIAIVTKKCYIIKAYGHILECLPFSMRNSFNVFRDLDGNIRDAVREHKASGNDGKQSLQEAQSSIQELFSRIKDIKTRSEKSEEMVCHYL